jgi:hypothetical protein
MEAEKKPSEKIKAANHFDGKVIEDEKGRKLRLKQPDILDEFDLMGALGKDSANPIYYMYAQAVLHIATIDDFVIEAPKTLREFRAAIRMIDRAGIEAFNKFSAEIEENRESENDRLKK